MTTLSAPGLLTSRQDTFSIRHVCRHRPDGEPLQRWPILLLVALAAIALFAVASLRHHLFRSAMDLAFFDQITFLISRGQTPVSSIAGWHVLGDHAAFILYLIAPLYWILPDAHVLLLVQAVALAVGAYPVWRLARLAGHSQNSAIAMSVVYLLYPIVLVANLYDFHPEVISVPAILFAVLAARERRMIGFVCAVVLALGGKEVIGITIAAMGIWLALFEDRKRFGAVAVIAGLGWFVVSTRWLIPHFGAGKQASGIHFFAYLGHSPVEILVNAIIHPRLWMGHMFTVHTFKYVAVLFAPLIWALRPRHMLPLICAAPTLALNVLAWAPNVDLTNPFTQYSLMIVPFIMLCVISAVAAREAWLTKPRLICMCSLAIVLIGAGARLWRADRYQATDFQNQLAAREAVERISGTGGVLTTNEIASHVSHRPLIQFITEQEKLAPLAPLENFDYVLLNLSQDSSKTSGRRTMSILERVQADHAFTLVYQRDWVYLFRRAKDSLGSEPAQARTE